MIRIISCLDIKNNFVVKGINFKNLKKISNLYDLSIYYQKNKIDELIFLDITANYTSKSLYNNIIKKISKKINFPISIGGGIKKLKDIKKIMLIGGDRIILNSIVYNDLKIIKNISNFYGSQILIVSVDVKKYKNTFKTYKNSGYINTNFFLKDWIIIISKLGCGEVLITSIENDGKCLGYKKELIYNIKNFLKISLIISGGFGCINDIYYIYKYFKVKAFLIASLFHKKYIKPIYIKKYIEFLKL